MMRIYVRHKHIKKGVPGHVHLCPIAHAIREHLVDKQTVSVEGYRVYIGGKEFSMPAKASRFMNRFDLNDVVKPFSFTLFER